MSEDRIIELESKVAYQEDLLQELNTIVIDQQSQLDKLSMLCQALNDRLKDAMRSLPDSSHEDERPPHY
ncbi:MAG: SlyX family protein [Gammaproteobacteria bacterium]|nr:SlyX family protein [Gammaproteobacteria bacterium]